MLFSLKKISLLAGSRQIYLRGVALYNAGAVKTLSCRADEQFAMRVTARVEDRAAGVFNTPQVGFNAAGDAVFYTCDCAYREGGACKHVVAALTYRYYRDMAGGSSGSSAAGNTAARRLLTQSWQSASTAISAAGGQTVSVIPTVRMAVPPTLTLSLRRGAAREYTVKDMEKFRESLIACETVTYGAQLTVVHHPASFDAADRALIVMIRTADAMTGHTRRELPLSAGMTDELFSIYEGRQLTVGERTLTCRRGDPPLTVTVRAQGDQTVLSCPVAPFAAGRERLYVPVGDTLWMSTPAFAEAVQPLLTALYETGGTLVLSAHEAAEFASVVLPRAERYIHFDGEIDRLRELRPLPPQAAIYLDLPDPATLTARVEFTYEDRTVLPGGGEDDAGRDRLREWQVLHAVSSRLPERTESGYRLSCDDEALFDLLTEGIPALSRVATVYVSDAFRDVRVLPAPSVSVGVRMKSDLLELQLDTGDLDRGELAALLDSYRARRRYHRLRSGAFLSLADLPLDGLARLAEGLGLSERKFGQKKITVPAYRAPLIDTLLAQGAFTGKRDEATAALIGRIRRAASADFAPPAALNGQLREYQKAGFSWLRTMEECGFGGILADDMGLGKTVQTIALFIDVKARGINLPSLVVCPASLVLNWESELHRFAPTLSVCTVTGDAARRADLLHRAGDADVVITSYDLLRRDSALYEGVPFYYHILDEAQYIKNHTTKNARAAKAIHSERRFALTGTPVENRLCELWSIFDFLMPGFLFSYARFRERFELPAVRDGDRQALAALSDLCAPFILRRLKQDVLRELPPKTESERVIPLYDDQRRIYRAALMRFREEENGQNAEGARFRALNALMRLRQICCDPALCFENWRGGSAKTDACIELVRQAVEEGHRVLLFSQFTSMLAVLRDRLTQEGIGYYLLQGDVSKEDRAKAVAAFQGEGAAPVFLISLKAGGTGLNLTAADVVIHFDPWWNLSVQNQATDRAYRIGQDRPVQVYKLIAQGTVEEKILRLQEQKQTLADAVVGQGGAGLSALSDEELLCLLSQD